MKEKNNENKMTAKTVNIVRKQGVVVSDKGDKTVVVSVTSKKPHPIYRKLVSKTKKYHAHDAENQYKVGDEVIIMNARPISKLKRFIVEKKVPSSSDAAGAGREKKS